MHPSDLYLPVTIFSSSLSPLLPLSPSLILLLFLLPLLFLLLPLLFLLLPLLFLLLPLLFLPPLPPPLPPSSSPPQNDLDDAERSMLFVCSATHRTKVRPWKSMWLQGPSCDCRVCHVTAGSVMWLQGPSCDCRVRHVTAGSIMWPNIINCIQTWYRHCFKGYIEGTVSTPPTKWIVMI